MFSLSLWHSSPKCYRLLRSTFSLPSVTTLRRSIHSIDMRPGFHSRILEGIKQKATTYTLQESLITIVFDEMSIKSSLNYDERLDKVVGYQDLGDNNNHRNIANHATVFMIRSIFGTWKQPVGYFLTAGPMKSDVILIKLKECIQHMKECGLIPKIVICDQGPSNRGCKALLNLTDEQYFIYSGDRIYFLYDPPHLIKSIRNALYNNGFLYKDNEVNFKYIEELYYIKKQGNIDIAGKLTKYHVMLNTFSKMKVNLAVQVLSQSVASGIRCVAHLTNKFPREAMYTADFCEFFNNLFDIFNSKGKFIYLYPL